MNNKFPKAGGVVAFLGVLAICLVFIVPSFFISIVDAGEIGVLNVFGNVSDTPLQPGINFKSPFATVIKMNTRTQQYTMSNLTEEGQRSILI